MKAVLPKSIRELRAQMELKALTLRDVSELTGIPYGTCSQLLNGKLIHPNRLALISKSISKAKEIREAVAA